MNEIFEERAAYSQERNTELKQAISDRIAGIQLPGLAIFTVGSYGRLEASRHSDVDLFFTYNDDDPHGTRRTNEYRLFGRLIDIVEELEYPALSNDAEFLQSHLLKDMLKNLGSPEDDHRNYFTSRMLLLLESRALYGEEEYSSILDSIIETYYRDYPRHEDAFRPWFLLNDIMRFWKTLLLNYENRRNDAPQAVLVKSRVKNFKLKYSRATTCFATIAAIGSAQEPVTKDAIRAIVSASPRQRLEMVASDIPSSASTVDDALEEYAWFLEQTAKPTEDLQQSLEHPTSRKEMFDRAQSYTERLYQIIREIDAVGDGKFLRSLVV
ncbi:hypothetical protein HQQ88_05340 [Curtobacterium sp. VKM Ac-2861]|uniref:nucleotidyltransferase domain-containing protein n=1 Tax=Curtobacterium sp. VKM Ac-2861 TaxID=2739016 RepID=UPI0015675700|nr:hypothetical protein [Curtobacterium sp. VKM Ac-2861]